MKNMYIYIMSNTNNTTLYIGVTNDLVRRAYEHRNRLKSDCFTAKYNLIKLVYFEVYEDELTAIVREKYLKKAFRKEKIKLITSINPNFDDLYNSICQ